MNFYKSDELLDDNKSVVLDLPFYSIKSLCQHVINHIELYTTKGNIKYLLRKCLIKNIGF